MLKTPQAGLTLLELMVGLAIIVIVLLAGVPGFSAWLKSTQVRNSAESMQNGLQVARAEAVRRNAPVTFYLVTDLTTSCTVDSGGANWIVSRDDPSSNCNIAPSESTTPRIIQKRGASDGSATVSVTASQSSVTFNSLGRPTNLAATKATIDVSNPSGGACVSASGPIRCLRVETTAGGQIRTCDAALASTDPRAC